MKIFIVCAFCFLIGCGKISNNNTFSYNNVVQVEKEDNLKSTENIETSFSSIPMNSAEIIEIILQNNQNQNEIMQLTGDTGTFFLDYGDNRIYIGYFRRNVEFDRIFRYEHMYDPDLFFSFDKGIEDNIIEFPHWFFFDNMRKRIINNIVLIDGFRFAAYESSNKELTRCLFFSSLNYNIIIQISLVMDDIIRYYDLIESEAPEYFDFDIYAPPGSLKKAWKDEESIIKFGSDLINEMNKSKTATEWYNETERLIGSFLIR